MVKAVGRAIVSATERGASPTWQWIFTTALVVIGIIAGYYAKSLDGVHESMDGVTTSVNELSREVTANQATIEAIADDTEANGKLSREVGETLLLIRSHLIDHPDAAINLELGEIEARIRILELNEAARE
jgi:hypothetical protein